MRLHAVPGASASAIPSSGPCKDDHSLIQCTLQGTHACLYACMCLQAVYRLSVDTTQIRADGFSPITVFGDPRVFSWITDNDLTQGRGFSTFRTSFTFHANFKNGKPVKATTMERIR